MILESRSDVMHAKDPNIIYIARNLICDGKTAYDTGFKPFYGDDANRDFKITIRISSITSNGGQDVYIGCKYEGTIDGQQWPGFYVRRNTSNTSTLQIGGSSYWTPYSELVLGRNLYLWREGGSWKARLENDPIQNLSVRVATFNQPIVIGAGLQTNGTYFRYSKCIIDYIRIEYI